MAAPLGPTLFFHAAAALQVLCAAVLLWGRRTPERVMAGLLLLANGAAALRLSQGGGWAAYADDTRDPLFTAFDGATSLLVLGLALALVRRPRPAEAAQADPAATFRAPAGPGLEPGWTAGAVAGLGCILAAALTVAATVRDTAGAGAVAQYIWLAGAPVFVGYALCTLWATRELAGAHGLAEARFAGLLASAFLARSCEFVVRYAVRGMDAKSLAVGELAPRVAYQASAALLACACAWALARLALAAARPAGPDPAGRTWALAGVLAAAVGVLLGLADTGLPPESGAVVVLTVLNLYFARPVLLAAAYEPRRLALALGWLAGATTAWLLVRSLIAAVAGLPLDRLTGADAAGAAIGALAATLAWAAWRPMPGRRRDAADLSTAQGSGATGGARLRGGERRPRRPTAAHRLAEALLASPQGLDRHAIVAATGIRPNNLHAEVQRLVHRLDRQPGASPASPQPAADPLVDVRVVGVRARKWYRLTAQGRERARLLLHLNGFHPSAAPSAEGAELSSLPQGVGVRPSWPT